MRINLRADGLDLTAHIRTFVESRVRSALGQFERGIAFVDVHLEFVRGGVRPNAAACSISVTLRPSGTVRSFVYHPWMRVAINRAASDAAGQVERKVRRRPSQAAPRPAVEDVRERAKPTRAGDKDGVSASRNGRHTGSKPERRR